MHSRKYNFDAGLINGLVASNSCRGGGESRDERVGTVVLHGQTQSILCFTILYRSFPGPARWSYKSTPIFDTPVGSWNQYVVSLAGVKEFADVLPNAIRSLPGCRNLYL